MVHQIQLDADFGEKKRIETVWCSLALGKLKVAGTPKNGHVLGRQNAFPTRRRWSKWFQNGIPESRIWRVPPYENRQNWSILEDFDDFKLWEVLHLKHFETFPRCQDRTGRRIMISVKIIVLRVWVSWLVETWGSECFFPTVLEGFQNGGHGLQIWGGGHGILPQSPARSQPISTSENRDCRWEKLW